MNRHWLGWATFLGMSWTWCIGMFLPVMLIRDYGVWAWVVFAIPNVVGAAAMGWVVSADRSRLILLNHRPAAMAFSIVTIAFQLFFAVWVFTQIPGESAGGGWFLLGVALIAAAATMRKWSWPLAVQVLAVSVFCAIGMFHDGEANADISALTKAFAIAPPAGVAWLIPICLFGFLLCPYLDSTFHRARQRLNDRSAKWAFGVGFGVVFFAAIILSLCYARPVNAAVYFNQRSHAILNWIKLYWMIQLGFTIGVHLLGDEAQNQDPKQLRSVFIGLAALAAALVALAVQWNRAISGETVYLCFLSFYGLVFPAYVWLCMIPGRGVVGPSRWNVNVLVAAVAIAAPMFWLAFINHLLPWGAVGVAAVLLSRCFISQPAQRSSRSKPEVLANA
jgi:hypothetical protein